MLKRNNDVLLTEIVATEYFDEGRVAAIGVGRVFAAWRDEIPDNSIWIWNYGFGKPEYLTSANGHLNDLVVSGDGNVVVYAAHDGVTDEGQAGEVIVFSRDERKTLSRINWTPEPELLSISDDGQMIAVRARRGSKLQSPKVMRWPTIEIVWEGDEEGRQLLEW